MENEKLNKEYSEINTECIVEDEKGDNIYYMAINKTKMQKLNRCIFTVLMIFAIVSAVGIEPINSFFEKYSSILEFILSNGMISIMVGIVLGILFAILYISKYLSK